jgi:hypothetical protein
MRGAGDAVDFDHVERSFDDPVAAVGIVSPP